MVCGTGSNGPGANEPLIEGRSTSTVALFAGKQRLNGLSIRRNLQGFIRVKMASDIIIGDRNAAWAPVAGRVPISAVRIACAAAAGPRFGRHHSGIVAIPFTVSGARASPAPERA